MRAVSPAVQAARSARAGIYAEHLIWIAARNRATGGTETMGLWTGPDNRSFLGRDYYGAGNVLDIEAITAQAGIEARTYQVQLAGITPEVELLIRGYETRLAPVEIHRAEFDGDHNLLGTERVFRGFADGAPIGIGESAVATLRVISESILLTRYGHLTKSDEAHRQRGGDRFRRYGSIADAEVVWGELRTGQSRLPSATMQQVVGKMTGQR